MTLSVYLSHSVPHVRSRLNVLQIAILVLAVVAGTLTEGAIGAAFAMLVVALVVMPVNFLILSRHRSFGFTSLARLLWRPMVATLAMYLSVGQISSRAGVETSGCPVATNALAFICGVLIHVLVIACIWILSGRPEGAERLLLYRTSALLPGVINQGDRVHTL